MRQTQAFNRNRNVTIKKMKQKTGAFNAKENQIVISSNDIMNKQMITEFCTPAELRLCCQTERIRNGNKLLFSENS